MNYETPLGEVNVKVYGHGSLLLEWNGKKIYVDPYSEIFDYSNETKADLILITHNHYDHYDEVAFSKIEKAETIFVVSADVGKVDDRYSVLNNGNFANYEGLEILAVPSYNINRRNEEGNLFHPKGCGNGYVLSFGGCKFYISGDTEPIEEMSNLGEIYVAFLPKNLPYTMTDEEFIAAANLISPKYLYPIHYFDIDIEYLRERINKEITIIN